jgi:hypothetical protein
MSPGVGTQTSPFMKYDKLHYCCNAISKHMRPVSNLKVPNADTMQPVFPILQSQINHLRDKFLLHLCLRRRCVTTS